MKKLFAAIGIAGLLTAAPAQASWVQCMVEYQAENWLSMYVFPIFWQTGALMRAVGCN
jgi:hypothetical protein